MNCNFHVKSEVFLKQHLSCDTKTEKYYIHHKTSSFIIIPLGGSKIRVSHVLICRIVLSQLLSAARNRPDKLN